MSFLAFAYSESGNLVKAAETSLLVFELANPVLDDVATKAILKAMMFKKQMGRGSEVSKIKDKFMEYFVGPDAYLEHFIERLDSAI